MQVNSYTFQSPYPQQVQIGRPDPLNVKVQDQPQNPALQEKAKTAVNEGKAGSVFGSEISVSLQALQAGSTQSGVAEFKSLVAVNQAQKAYLQG